MPILTEPPPPASPPRAYSRRTSPAVRIVDRLTTVLITAGGLMVIVAVVGMLIYLVSVVVPLFRGATLTPAGSYPLLTAAEMGELVAVQLDEHQQTGYLLDRHGRLRVFEVATGQILSDTRLFSETATVTAVARTLRGGHVGFGFADGTIRLGRIRFTGAGVEAKLEEPLLVGAPAVPVHRLDYKVGDRREVVTVLKADGYLVWDEVTRRENIVTGKVTLRLAKHELPYRPPAGRTELPAFLLQNEQGDQVYLAWSDGLVQRYDLRRISEPLIAETTDVVAAPDATLTRLQFMFGDQSLIAGDSRGGVTAWFRVHRPGAATGDEYQLVPAHQALPHDEAVVAVDMSVRDKCFVSGDATGAVWLRHMTSDRVLAQTRLDRPVAAVHLAPKGDGLLALDQEGRAYRWQVRNPHPETTWKTIFGKVWYEGYDEPGYTWQSSSANDDFEPKFSLIPLMFGTLKATIYSMLFAVPIALLAAIYTSQFLDKNLRMPIKSAVETMASLPSVVLGFVAALVLAPIVEQWVVAVLVTFALIPLVVLIGGYLWQMLPRHLTVRAEGWPKFVLLIAGALLAAWLARGLGGPVERWLFAGDFKAWLDRRAGTATPGNAILAWPVALAVVWYAQHKLVAGWLARQWAGRARWVVGTCELVKLLVILAATTGLAGLAGWVLAHAGWDPRGTLVNTYVQRNTLVVGFVMGFAVIPIIYTISEDALSSVPEHLKSASLGCGATPWQTAVRVILPVAMSGIFSAVMVGLGRAVGETMIVVMAAGNTPILDINIFSGLRALSANIAVELPEAVKDSTLFRMLFLAAVVLFLMTFTLNTVAEIIRQRFRKRAFQL